MPVPKLRRLSAHAALAALALTSALAARAAPLPPAPPGSPPSTVPTAVQNARWHMLDPGINAFTFRNMDQIFTTRSVPRAGAVWTLPSQSHSLDFTYQVGEQTLPAQAIFERNATNALLILKDGHIVHETYRNRSDADTRFIGWSMTKSIVATLVGIALADQKIANLDDPVTRYLPELASGGYAGVSVRQVLEMRSGVDYEERYDFQNPGVAAANHLSSLVRNTSRFADAAKTIPRVHEPGTHFAYKTLDTAVLGWLLERVTGMSVSAYMAQKLWEPLGAQADGFFILDGEPGVGREFTGAGFNATARDFARLGQLMLQEGEANGQQIVPADWVREATTTRSQGTARGGYGYQWWTVPETGAYFALGLQGQIVYVDPATRTVAVKLSYWPPGPPDAWQAEALDFLKAAAAWQP